MSGCCCCCCASAEANEQPVELSDVAQGSSGQRRPKPAFQVKRENRSCTDVVCLLLFLLCLAGLGVVSYFAFTTGDPYTLLYPTDSQGNLCGRSNRTASLRHLVFFDLMECLKMGPTAILAGGCPTPQVCVEKCPSKTWAWMELWLAEQLSGPDAGRRKADMVCGYGDPQNDTELSVQQLVQQRQCAPYYLNSTPVAGRCIPSIFASGVNLASSIISEAGQQVRTADNLTEVRYGNISSASAYLGLFLSSVTVAQNAFHDVVESRFLILAGVGVGAATAFAWCALLRCCAGVVVYGSLLAFFLTFAGVAGYCSFVYFTDRTLQSFSEALGNEYFTTNFSVYLRIKETWLGFAIVAGVVLLVVLVLLLFLRRRLRLAVALIREASKAIAHIPSALAFPLLPLILEVGVIVIFAANAALLASSGKKLFADTNSTTRETRDCQPGADGFLGCQFLRYGGNDWSYYLHAYNLFMAFWLSAFVVAFGQLALAGAFASYYWAWRKPDDIPALPLAWSLFRAARYHLGTVAFGSLLVAVVKLIRALLRYLESKLKDGENPLVKFAFCCLQCCFWCLEKFLKFLSKNAYIVTAVNGKNFCAAAKQAFGIVCQNILRFVVVDRVTDFVLFVSKLIVAGLVTALAFLFFNGRLRLHSAVESLEVELHYFFVPVILICISTWIIASIFFSVFDFAVDTMLICAMVDCSKNDGSEEKPYFMSKGLMKVLDTKNKMKESDKAGAS